MDALCAQALPAAASQIMLSSTTQNREQ
jgi:hypothetical protein